MGRSRRWRKAAARRPPAAPISARREPRRSPAPRSPGSRRARARTRRPSPSGPRRRTYCARSRAGHRPAARTARARARRHRPPAPPRRRSRAARRAECRAGALVACLPHVRGEGAVSSRTAALRRGWRFAAAGRGGYCAGMPDPVAHASFLPPVLIFCAAAVIAVPLFRRLGLSGVLGYLAAGIVIGPSGLSLIGEPETVRGVAELGVVLLLFIVGLELKLSRLISMRRDIFGLGAAQLGVTVAVFAATAVASGLVLRSAVVVGIALALSATSIALQMLEERGDLQASYGQRSFAILLFQDLSIAPILALMPLLASAGVFREHGASLDMLIGIATALAALAAVVLVGRYGLNPFFQLLASSGAREVMTASALLVVLGAALVMEKAGLSMAMGAFLAGVLLAESNFRHQLEADIEPFRGMLLGLFFMSVGMSIEGGVVRAQWLWLVAATLATVAGKAAIVAVLLRIFGSPRLPRRRSPSPSPTAAPGFRGPSPTTSPVPGDRSSSSASAGSDRSSIR